MNYSIGAQTLKVISGKIIDSKDNLPIPFVHIQVKGTGVGTISNKNGCFSLKIPAIHHEKKLLVSFIGYEPFESEIKSINKTLQIKLKSIDYQIGEVIIMPDSTLLTLLEKAFNKIPENFPDFPTSLTGFYRESVKTTNNDYAYFSEAVTQTYKSSYKKSNVPGQVKIIKSLINEFPKIDSLKTRFYGGVFEASNGDVVLRRGSYINPKNFKNYSYTLEGITKFNDNEVYIISFDTKNDSLSGTLEGRFYLDKASLAYIYLEYQLTPKGLKKFSSNISIKRNVKMLKKTINYVKLRDKWHFKHSKSTEHFLKGNHIIWVKEDEYLTTKVQIDSVKPISLGDRLEYGDIFSEKAKDYYSDDYWEEYNVLKKDSLLDKQLKMLYDTTQSKKILTQKTKYKKKTGKKNSFLKTILNMSFGYGLSYYPVYADKGIYNINYHNSDEIISLNEELDAFRYSMNLLIQINYDLNYRWSLNFAITSSLTSKLNIETYDIGASYRILLNKRIKPLILNLSLLYSYNCFARNFSTYENNNKFDFGNKTIDAQKLLFAIGYNSGGIKPKVNLEYKFKRRIWLYISSSYYIPFFTKEKLFLKEKSGIVLTRKNANISLADELLNVTYDGIHTTKSHMNFHNYSISLGFILRF
ncbi:MAG: carboxypeptidase-like regulatory domain-containing protein [Bacteroidota bacterium]